MLLRCTTLLYLRRETSVLLARKKRGFGLGKWNGVGGKVDPLLDGTDTRSAEAIRNCAIRECVEECGVTLPGHDSLRFRGILHFYYAQNTLWNNRCFVFESWGPWEGSPSESDEMEPAWFQSDQVDYSTLWEDDEYWFPLLLNSTEPFYFQFHFDESGSLNTIQLHEKDPELDASPKMVICKSEKAQ